MWAAIRYVETRGGGGPKALIVIFLLGLAGAFTQHYFALVALGACVLVTFTLFKSAKLAWFKFHLALAAAYALFLLTFPALEQQSRARAVESEPFGIASAFGRLKTAATTVPQFLVHARVGDALLVLVTVVLALAVLAILWKRPWVGERGGAGGGEGAKNALFFLVWNLGSLIALFVAGASPSYAMAAKYFAFVWPLFGLVPVLASRLLGARWRPALLIGLCVWQALYGALFAAVTLNRVRGRTHPSTLLNAADGVLVDSVSRGVLPRVFFMMRDDGVIFAERQKNLIADEGRWLGELPENGVYVSNLDYGNTVEQRAAIRARIGERRRVDTVECGMYNFDFARFSPPR